VQETLTVGMLGRGICSVLFLDAVLMVASPAFVAAPDGERSPCEGFSLSQTYRFGSLEFTADLFIRLSLSFFGDSLGTTTGPARGQPPLLQRTEMGGPIGGVRHSS
jgi:hypothetical protein